MVFPSHCASTCWIETITSSRLTRAPRLSDGSAMAVVTFTTRAASASPHRACSKPEQQQRAVRCCKPLHAVYPCSSGSDTTVCCQGEQQNDGTGKPSHALMNWVSPRISRTAARASVLLGYERIQRHYSLPAMPETLLRCLIPEQKPPKICVVHSVLVNNINSSSSRSRLEPFFDYYEGWFVLCRMLGNN
jgi:hypothetical protein